MFSVDLRRENQTTTSPDLWLRPSDTFRTVGVIDTAGRADGTSY